MSRSYEREERKAREKMIETILAEDKVGHLTRTFLEKRMVCLSSLCTKKEKIMGTVCLLTGVFFITVGIYAVVKIFTEKDEEEKWWNL